VKTKHERYEYNRQWAVKNRERIRARERATRHGTLIRQARSPGEPITKDFIIIRCRFDYANGCWEWQRGIGKKGYGVVSFQGKSSQTLSRVVWILWNGPIPDGLCVLHKCDNPPCCNPDHLFLGTHKQNALDKIMKGRHQLKYSKQSSQEYQCL